MTNILAFAHAPKTVYFIRPIGMDGPVKIGCSEDPALRLRDFLIWSPFPLEIVAEVQGDYDLEQNLHECFADHHSHREWFLANPKLTKLISDLKSGMPIAMAFDLTARVGAIRGKNRRKYSESERVLLSYRSRLQRLVSKVNTVNGKWRFRFEIPAEIDRLIDTWQRMVRADGEPPMPGEHVIKALEHFIANPVFKDTGVTPSEKTGAAA